MLKDFKKHSSISSGEYIKFMCQNNNSDDVSTYKTQMCCMENKMKTMQNEINAKFKYIETKVEGALKSSSGSASKVKALEDTVKKLATKGELNKYQMKNNGGGSE